MCACWLDFSASVPMSLSHGKASFLHLYVRPQFTRIPTGQILLKRARNDHLIGLYPGGAQGQGHICCFTGNNL